MASSEFWRVSRIAASCIRRWLIQRGLLSQHWNMRTGQPLLPAFHLLNLLLHTGRRCICLSSVERIDRPRARLGGRPCFLYYIHCKVEPVAWIAKLNNLLFGMLSLAALWQYVRYAKIGGRWRYAVASLLYAAALLSKPAATVVAPIAVVLDVLVLARPAETLRPIAGIMVCNGRRDCISDALTPTARRGRLSRAAAGELGCR